MFGVAPGMALVRLLLLVLPLLLLHGCALDQSALRSGDLLTGSAGSGHTMLAGDLTPEKLRNLDAEAPPKATGPVPSYAVANPGAPGSGRRRASGLLKAGIVLTTLGTVFMISGVAVIAAPSNCSGTLCGLGQAIAGASLMGAGGLSWVIGIPMLGVGGYRYTHAEPGPASVSPEVSQ